MADKTSRPATRDDLKLVLKLLNEGDVDYMMVGGYAMIAHGSDRTTTDIDILVPANLDTGKKVIRALMALPDQAVKDMKPEWLTEGGTIRVFDDFVVDVMTNANGHTYEALSRYAETTSLDEIPFRTLNLQGLLLTKQTTRAKDVADRLAIERALVEMGKQPESEEKQAPVRKRAGGILGCIGGILRRAMGGK
jgi:hypothetical protein